MELVQFSRPYDTRTKECDKFLQYILSSPVRNESPLMVIGHISPINREDFACKDMRLSPHLSMPISVSPSRNFRTKIGTCHRTLQIAQFGPLLHALPYVVNLFTHPPHEVDEMIFPTRRYVTTIEVWFKDWGIQIDAFRK